MVPKISSYSFGKIEIDGKEYTNDVIIFPDRIEDNWWRKEGHSLLPEDIEEVIDESPDLIIVGTGANGRVSVPGKTKRYIESKGIELMIDRSNEAVKAYNNLRSEKSVVVALHLTC